jgi:2-dehydro-3-deoxyphosphooctonate aldolase (KDO 8-P synthase)
LYNFQFIINFILNNNFSMSKESHFFIIAGPCVVESFELLSEAAETLKAISMEFEIPLYFKSSYKKANRTSLDSFTGIGDIEALEYLSQIKREFNLPVITDIHSVEEAKLAAKYVDVLQIPAFLSRQTELLIAAGNTGKIVNIKKGQFMAPADMKMAAEKVAATGNNDIWLTERGTFFGYHDLVVDFRSLILMKQIGYPVVFDATHSVQQPSIGIESGGKPEFIYALARAAAAVGIDGIFFETHPNPAMAKSDAATQLPLSKAREFIEIILDIHSLVQQYEL